MNKTILSHAHVAHIHLDVSVLDRLGRWSTQPDLSYSCMKSTSLIRCSLLS
jgi:hypothetical protein